MPDPSSTYAERIEHTSWSQLQLVEGPATEVPARLLALIGKDEDAAVSAAQILGLDLCYEDALVCEATVIALPFLLEAAACARGKVRLEIFAIIRSICEASGGFLDPYDAVRPLPGAEIFFMGVSALEDRSTGVTGELRAILLEALPDLLQLAVRISEPAHRPKLTAATVTIARSLGAISETSCEHTIECLREAYEIAEGQPRLQILFALKALGGTDRIPEPLEAYARWIWLAATKTRAPGLEGIVCEASEEDCDAFDDLRIGLDFFVGLGAALLQVKPHLQMTVAERFVAQIKRRATVVNNPSKYMQAPGLGRAALVLAFPGGKATDLLRWWQVDLIELFYRDAFMGNVNRGTHLTLIGKLGLPRFREPANEWLISHGRPPVI